MGNNPVRYYLTRLFCWTLLLQMINISVDPPNIRHFLESGNNAAGGTMDADMDTVYEMVAEALLDADIPETGEGNDIEKLEQSVELFCYKPVFNSFVVYHVTLLHNSRYHDPISVQPTEPSAPPPERALITS